MIFAKRALLPSGWVGNVRVTVDGGRIASVTAGAAPAAGDARVDTLLPALPFSLAEYNFYRAAQHGLEARLVWPDPSQTGCRERPVSGLLEDLLPLAREGLRSIGVEEQEAARYLDVIERRLAARQTGASWQRGASRRLEAALGREQAAREMLAQYYELSMSNLPVSEWK